jgi:hypothetical protein
VGLLNSAFISDGTFHHVAFTVDRDGDSGTQVYIDGTLLYAVPGWPNVGDINNSEDLLIGWDDGGGFLDGAVDEVILFRRVITADEVAALAGVRESRRLSFRVPASFACASRAIPRPRSRTRADREHSVGALRGAFPHNARW